MLRFQFSLRTIFFLTTLGAGVSAVAAIVLAEFRDAVGPIGAVFVITSLAVICPLAAFGLFLAIGASRK